jgi:hypothetical protein
MRTPADTWIELIQRLIEEGRASGLDSYVLALHIYADVMVKALQEKQDEFDSLSFSPRNLPPN